MSNLKSDISKLDVAILLSNIVNFEVRGSIFFSTSVVSCPIAFNVNNVKRC